MTGVVVTNLWAIVELVGILSVLFMVGCVWAAVFVLLRGPRWITHGIVRWLWGRSDRDERMYRAHRKAFNERGREAMKRERIDF